MLLTPVGIYIAKAIFQVHYVDGETGEIVNKPIKRAKFLEYSANRTARLIGMEASGGAQHWARALTRMGHHRGLIPAEFAKAFNIRNENDAADAQAIWLAVRSNLAGRSRSRLKHSRWCWHCTGCGNSWLSSARCRSTVRVAR
jgi:transposase